jgi:GMP synthase (glutamine-hydrolysing)
MRWPPGGRGPASYGSGVKPILVIEQEPSLEGTGLLGKRLEAHGLPYRRLRTWRESFEGVHARDYAAVMPLGGNMHAWREDEHPFLRDERLLLGEALEEGVPVLGICLGAQLLARTLGADVAAGSAPEIGWLEVTPTPAAASDPVLGHLGGPASVFQWHVDAFELPPGASRLATSPAYPNQAFRHGDSWGVQFHPEVDFDQFEIWIGNQPGAAAANGIDEAKLRAAVRRGSRSAASRAFREGLFDRFLAYATR